MVENYTNSVVQKLSLAGAFLAGVLILVGGGSPFWMISDPSLKSGKIYFGLYVFCLQSDALKVNDCEAIEFNNHDGWFYSCRIVAALCILMACINGLCALCLACCSCCRRFIALGISEFIAAVFGAFAAGSFAKNTETVSDKYDIFYGWGFYIFTAGVVVMGVVSFAACFAAPDSALHGMIFSQGGPSVIVQTSSSMSSNPYFNFQQQSNGVQVNAGNGFNTGY